MSIAAMQADGVACSWDEAVAIGQALCRVFTASQLLRRIVHDPDATDVPVSFAADTVFIDATGRVTTTAGDPHDVPEAIRSIGSILSHILPAGDVLSFRTKILSKALASPPQFGTIDELEAALAVYQHPNRRALIQALYERWAKHAVPPTEAVIPIVPPTTPPVVVPDPAPVRSTYHPAEVVAGAGIVAAVAIIGICGLLLIRARDGTRSIAAEPAPTSQPQQVALPPEISEPAPSAVDTTQVLEPAAPPLTIEVTVRPPAARPPASSRAVTTPRVAKRAAPSGTSDGVTLSNKEVPLGSATRPSVSNPPAAASSGSGARPQPRAAARIYGPSDADVVPPTPVYAAMQMILEPSSPGVRLDALAIAVVVNEDGTVDSVKGATRPQSVGEYMLLTSALSVVKLWHFTPALKDGTAVKYRQIVPLRLVTRPEH